MRTRTTADHQDVVARRLELLRAELAGAPPRPSSEVSPEDPEDDWWGGHTQLPEPVPEVPEESRAALVPVPGRHADRRRRAVDLTTLVPEPVRGRVGLGPWHLTVVALLVALGLGVACWWVVRSDAAPAAAPTPVSTGSPLVPLSGADSASPVVAPPAGAQPSGTPSPGASSSGGTVTVDVEGKVRRPGIAVLPSGSRIVDAIRAAGGAPRRRDLAGLNLAAVLADGQQIVVGGSPGSTASGVPTGAPTSSTSGAPTALVNLNTATAEELDTLPDVGPVTAQSILEWRDANGGFTSVDELLEVDGIGDATLAKIAPYVTV